MSRSLFSMGQILCFVIFPCIAMAGRAAAAEGIPPLPEPVASFGGAVHDGWLYVYSGHTGQEHEHSRENLSKNFVRAKIDGDSQWEELPIETPLQGLPLVAHGDYIYRIGGLSAHNAPGEKEDLHSVDEFARFDPKSKTWMKLAPLPEPRSSHDAVVIGDKLYIVGGWQLTGPGDGEWLETAWVYDLAANAGNWREVPKPPFLRRALAAAHWNGKLVALCGMTDDAEVSQRVDFFNSETGKWEQGPDLPSKRLKGFGVSAWNLDGRLYVSGFEGVVYRLSDDGKSWESATKLKRGRFFHRLLPGGPDTLLVVGGASFKGHLAEIESVSVTDEPMETTAALP